jgi:hypothetical protein
MRKLIITVLVLVLVPLQYQYGQTIDYVETQWSFYVDTIVQTLDCSSEEERALKDLRLYGIDTIAKYTLISSWEKEIDLTEMTTIMGSQYYVCTLIINDKRYYSKPILLQEN